MRTKKVIENTAPILALSHGLSFSTDATVNGMILKRFRQYNYLTHTDAENRAILEDCINKWADYFNQLWKLRGYTEDTTPFQYNPIENYDRNEEWSDTRQDYLKEQTKQETTPDEWKETTTNTPGHTYKETITKGADKETITPTTTKTVENSGYDSNTMTGTYKETDGGTNIRDNTWGNVETTHTPVSGSDKVEREQSGTITVDTTKDNTGKQTFKKEGRVHGNIGVTTTAQMLQGERELIISYTTQYVDKFADCFGIDCGIYYEPEEEEEEEEEEEP